MGHSTTELSRDLQEQRSADLEHAWNASPEKQQAEQAATEHAHAVICDEMQLRELDVDYELPVIHAQIARILREFPNAAQGEVLPLGAQAILHAIAQIERAYHARAMDAYSSGIIEDAHDEFLMERAT